MSMTLSARTNDNSGAHTQIRARVIIVAKRRMVSSFYYLHQSLNSILARLSQLALDLNTEATLKPDSPGIGSGRPRNDGRQAFESFWRIWAHAPRRIEVRINSRMERFRDPVFWVLTPRRGPPALHAA